MITRNRRTINLGDQLQEARLFYLKVYLLCLFKLLEVIKFITSTKNQTVRN